MAPRAGVGLVGIQRRDLADMPLPIRGILAEHHAEARPLHPLFLVRSVLLLVILIALSGSGVPALGRSGILRAARAVGTRHVINHAVSEGTSRNQLVKCVGCV
ncbi:hypothetical protein GCM10017709_33340 [Glutamicibacter nicotianae]|uniref:H repeat-associated protein N-terminal domain-containing protein n=1 Tax=Glutamicibacter nicotianae TaxID=37929 RepID=A0ABQ0RNQ3_GLUNI|nr:hypothetical protein ANI01nite_26470 [Glutamicibacter nicotianae]